MLRWFQKRLKPVARGLLAAVASLWLVAAAAPCVMAQAHQMDSASRYCPMQQDNARPGTNNDCGPVVSVDCKLPDINSPLAAALGDFTATPVLLTTLPVPIVLPQTRQHPQNDFFTPDIPAPPLHIQHLTLIL